MRVEEWNFFDGFRHVGDHDYRVAPATEEEAKDYCKEKCSALGLECCHLMKNYNAGHPGGRIDSRHRSRTNRGSSGTCEERHYHLECYGSQSPETSETSPPAAPLILADSCDSYFFWTCPSSSSSCSSSSNNCDGHGFPYSEGGECNKCHCTDGWTGDGTDCAHQKTCDNTNYECHGYRMRRDDTKDDNVCPNGECNSGLCCKRYGYHRGSSSNNRRRYYTYGGCFAAFFLFCGSLGVYGYKYGYFTSQARRGWGAARAGCR